jgi:hypothetical protein
MSENKSERKTETLISIIVLAALAAAVGAVLYVQSDYDMSRYGVNTGEKRAIAGGADDKAFAVSDKFSPMSPPEEYLEDTLYEKINGKAPLYTSAGFERLDTQRFTLNEKPDVWIEIYRYRMSTPAAAFSVYSTQKRSGAQVIDGLSPEHFYKTTSGLYAAAGQDYFEISASAEDDAVVDALIADIEDIAALDRPENSPLEIPEFLPDSKAAQGSFKLYLDGAFGIGELGKVYIRDYVIDGETITSFVILDGVEAMDKFESFMDESGAMKVSEDDGIDVYDLYGVYELITVKDGRLIGVHEAYDEETARELMKKMINQ